MSLDFESLRSFSILGIGLVFIGGLLTSLGPCNVATIPLIVGFIGGSHDLPRRKAFTISLAFATGLAITFVSLGVVAALIGGLIGASNRWWYYLVAGMCFIIGLQMLGVIHLSIPSFFARVRENVGLKGISGALVLGLVSGLVASQCATPVLAAILTYVMAEGAIVYGALLLFVYALGRGVPVVLAGTFTGVLINFQKVGRWNDTIEKISGVIVLAVGFYFLWIA